MYIVKKLRDVIRISHRFVSRSSTLHGSIKHNYPITNYQFSCEIIQTHNNDTNTECEAAAAVFHSTKIDTYIYLQRRCKEGRTVTQAICKATEKLPPIKIKMKKKYNQETIYLQ